MVEIDQRHAKQGIGLFLVGDERWRFVDVGRCSGVLARVELLLQCGVSVRRHCGRGTCFFWRSRECRSGLRFRSSALGDLRGARAHEFFGAQQVFDAVEYLLACAAADQSGPQLQLVMRDPECRMAMRTLGSERHCSYWTPADWPDIATKPSCSAHTDILRNGA
jgi:hypothetical protein